MSNLAIAFAFVVFAGSGLCTMTVTDPPPDTVETGTETTYGACCEGTICAVRSAAGCESVEGAFAGADTTCEDVDCGLRACCRPGYAECILLAADDCAGWSGTSHADSVTCEPNPCLPEEGACCTGMGCIVTSEDVCASYEDSSWLGVGASCEPDPC